jgi:DNA-binding transcriptional regulator YhcF (GntR family)
MANYEETSFIWNNKKQILRKGQLLTGLKVLSKETGIAQTTVYRILNYLENEKQIKQEKTTKYTVITILNWDKYQDKNQEMENRWKTNGKQTETYNNVYNNINKQEEKISSKEKERKEREYLRTQELLRRSK